jgi:DNA-binding PadR family transcriptional regulator
MTRASPPTYLPLSETTFYILLSLAPESKHGYAIMKEVASLSGRRVLLSTGTLYGALKRLLGQGWIRRVEAPNGRESGRIRKSYTLTRLGQQILKAEIERLERLVRSARRRPLKEPA